MEQKNNMHRAIITVAVLCFFLLAASYEECTVMPVWANGQLETSDHIRKNLPKAVQAESEGTDASIHDLSEKPLVPLIYRRSERTILWFAVFFISSFFSGSVFCAPKKRHFFTCVQSYILSLIRVLYELMIRKEKDGKKRTFALQRIEHRETIGEYATEDCRRL